MGRRKKTRDQLSPMTRSLPGLSSDTPSMLQSDTGVVVEPWHAPLDLEEAFSRLARRIACFSIARVETRSLAAIRF